MTIQQVNRGFWPGDAVQFVLDRDIARFPGVYQIARVNPKTISLVGARGEKVKASPGLLRLSDEPFVRQESDVELHLGTTVRFKPDARVRDEEKSKIFVTIKHGSTPGTWNLAELNGNDDRYFRSINDAVLERVDL